MYINKTAAQCCQVQVIALRFLMTTLKIQDPALMQKLEELNAPIVSLKNMNSNQLQVSDVKLVVGIIEKDIKDLIKAILKAAKTETHYIEATIRTYDKLVERRFPTILSFWRLDINDHRTHKQLNEDASELLETLMQFISDEYGSSECYIYMSAVRFQNIGGITAVDSAASLEQDLTHCLEGYGLSLNDSHENPNSMLPIYTEANKSPRKEVFGESYWTINDGFPLTIKLEAPLYRVKSIVYQLLDKTFKTLPEEQRHKLAAESAKQLMSLISKLSTFLLLSETGAGYTPYEIDYRKVLAGDPPSPPNIPPIYERHYRR